MKCSLPCFAAALIAASFNLYAEDLPPGHVDFGAFSPPGSGGQFVEVNLTSNLISLAARFVENEDADIAKLIKGLHSIRVNVVGLNDQNRGELEERIQSVRQKLSGNGWERIVTAQQEGQDVGVYLKTKNSDTVQGLVVTVIEGKKQAVFVNVVGNIKPEQLSMLGEKFHIEPLKKISTPPAEKPAEN